MVLHFFLMSTVTNFSKRTVMVALSWRFSLLSTQLVTIVSQLKSLELM